MGDCCRTSYTSVVSSLKSRSGFRFQVSASGFRFRVSGFGFQGFNAKTPSRKDAKKKLGVLPTVSSFSVNDLSFEV